MGAEIRRTPATTDQEIQVPSPTPDSFSGYSTPNFSPVQPREIPDLSPLPISPIYEGFEDAKINRLLDYLNSEEFLDEIIEQ